MPRNTRRASFARRVAHRVPGVLWLSQRFARVAAYRVGRWRVGLFALLPVAIFIDVFDAADEFLGGPIGMAAAFVLESAFLFGVTERTEWALGGALWDLIPGLDVVPVATLTVLSEILRDFTASGGERFAPTGPVIDV